METSAIHQRSQEALGQMAERGELFRTIAASYVVGSAGRSRARSNLVLVPPIP